MVILPHNNTEREVILIGSKHDKLLYVRTSDFGVWNRFCEKYGEKRSKVIMSLIREHMKKEGEPEQP